MTSTYLVAYEHPIINEIIDILVKNLFYKDNNIEIKHDIDPSKMRQASWLATILALSKNEKHLVKALAFSVLAFRNFEDNELYKQLCYIIMSRIGNIPITIHLRNIIDEETDTFTFKFDNALDLELSLQRMLSHLDLGDQKIRATNFQKNIWSLLNNKQFVSISGPTSSGKSFMIQSYIVKKCLSEKEYKAIYIVPTRALIYEVSSSFKKRLKGKEVRVKTGIGTVKEEILSNKEIFVLTPERGLKLIELNEKKPFKPDLIFFDEIQNLEDKERGILFEYILSELTKRWGEAKVIVAGPYLDNLKKTMKDIGQINSDIIRTFLPPVFQMKSTFQFSKKNKKGFTAFIKSPSGKNIELSLPIEKALYGKIKTDRGNALSCIIRSYGGDTINIIYSPRRDSAENWALALAQHKDYKETNTTNEEILDLIEYLAQEVHPEYSLIRCLKKGIAYHHSCLPEIARLELEDLYKQGAIQNLFCTTTLLQGVNLPPDKMFVITPKKSNKDLESFEFGNLIGRAGRIQTHLYGSVYCIEIEDDQWANEKLNSDFSKEIIPATTKAFMEKKGLLLKSINLPATEIEDSGVSYTISLIRHKFLRSPEIAYEYFKEKGLNKEESAYMIQVLDKTMNNITIPIEVSKLNPTIDPLLQDVLYRRIIKEGKDEWLINKHPYQSTDDSAKDIEHQRMLTFKEKNFYAQFEDITERLDEIFRFLDEQKRIVKLYYTMSIRNAVTYAIPWLRGYPYKKIIERDLKRKTNQHTDTIIRNVIKYVNDLVRFQLVKYYKVWSDI